MKKNTFIITAILFMSVFFSGCFNDVFYEINNDVAPEDGTVTGIIRSISRYTVDGKEFLVTISSDGLKYKPVDAYDVALEDQQYSKHGCWNLYSKNPDGFTFLKYDYYNAENFVGQQMLKTATDSDYIYLITAEYTNDIENGEASPSKMHLYATKISGLNDDGTWKDDADWSEVLLKDSDGNSVEYLYLFDYDDLIISAFNMFSTNSVQSAHRKAYIRSGGSSTTKSMDDDEYADFLEDFKDDTKQDYPDIVYYELSGSELIPVSLENFDTDSSLNYGINSAVWYNGDVLFFDTIAAETNETYEKDASKIYYSVLENKKDYLYYYDGTTSTKLTEIYTSSSVYISAFAVCADCLLIGKASYGSSSSSASGGIAKVALTEDGVPSNEFGTFESNASIKLKTAYFILTLLNENPARTEAESNLFASLAFLGTGSSNSANFDNLGLWSYYYSRGNWNKE